MKPSLHELISNYIHDVMPDYDAYEITKDRSDEIAEAIIKIVRNYHLVE